MEFSEYENIEIFNKTQRFGINKYENQIIRLCKPCIVKIQFMSEFVFQEV
jgi:hypothetical protein